MEFEVRLVDINSQILANTIVKYKVKDINNITNKEEIVIKARGERVLKKEIGLFTQYGVEFRTIPDGDFDDIVFWGWISLSSKLSKRQQRKRMINLGARGKIKYSREYKCFEYCLCSFQSIKNLINEPFIPMWTGCFTAVDEDDHPLSNDKQLNWS